MPAAAKEPEAKPAEPKDGFQNLDQEVFDRIRGIFGSGATPSKALRAAREGDAGAADEDTEEKKKAKRARGKRRK